MAIFSVLFFLILPFLYIALAPQFGKKPFGSHLLKLKKSRQYRIDCFDNTPHADPVFTMKGIWDILSHIREARALRRPQGKLPSSRIPFDRQSGAHLTWFGHSTFLYEVDGKKILIDPMLGTYASPIPGFIKRYPYDLPSSAEHLPHLDAIIISHDHYDHLDYGTILKLKDKVDRFFTPLGVGSHLVHWGVPKSKITELDWWESANMDQLTIHATPSQHFSGRSLTDRKKTLWASWVIQSSTAKIFFGGDSGYFKGFSEIGEKLGPFDLTLLDSGQYNEHWKEVHMTPEESVQAHQDLRGVVFMPIHWSAFTLSFHAWTDPAERAVSMAEIHGITMVTPKIGERFDVLVDRPEEKWWRAYQ